MNSVLHENSHMGSVAFLFFGIEYEIKISVDI